MSHIIRDAWAVPDSSYQTKNNVLTDDSCHGGTEPSIVMAEQSPQDVVKQEQSVDDLSSTDVSATHTTDSAARAALESLSATSTVQTYHTPSSSEPPGRLDNHDESQFISKQADIEGSASAVTEDTPVVNRSESALLSQEFVTGIDPYGNEPQDPDVAEDDSTRGNGFDGSVGSDTDTSKVDSSDAAGRVAGDGQDLIRPNALKKSMTFKPVSVTKSFLAKAGTASTPTTKAGADKMNGVLGTLSAAVSQVAPRPRLVAKSASGHRNSIPKALNMGTKAGKGAGPDPLQVWNRNRVATPQATPKHLTDEELRQQYGIQLASRPQEDADGKEAKWADIDDDEDDWTPETIEWNDGTKINLAQIDHKATLAAEEVSLIATIEKETATSKQKLPILKPITSVGPNATVLKLGSPATPKSGGLVLKGSSEKPTLVAKPSSNQVKSPWASLPPVDKASPVPINAPLQAATSRFTPKDPHGFESMPSQPTVTKEIAADDFSRSSRESQSGFPRELFNSQSGRYEPVNDSRRGSTTRKEQNFRAPSVLQRPNPGDQRGPAEPSAAFQTSRSGQQESASWTRRRTSSNASGESGRLNRRASVSKGFDVPRLPGDLQQRRDSQLEQLPLTPGLALYSARTGQPSPVHSQGQSITSQSPTIATSQHLSTTESAITSPQQIHAQPVIPPISNSAVTDGSQDAVAAQRKLMREKREAAIKRKAEEEAKEEGERRERIRVKMEELGLVDRKTDKKETAVEAASSTLVPKEPQESHISASRSPPKPPIPSASGAPQQYGMMKVHSSHPASGVADKKTLDLPKLPAEVVSSQTTEDLIRPKHVLVDILNGDVDQETEEIKHPPSSEQDVREPTPDAVQQTWEKNQQISNGYPSWNNTVMTTHSPPSGSLWGPPTNHRALGNGDFQPNMQRQQSRQLPYQSHPASAQPQPIGTPRHLQQPRGPTGHGPAKTAEVSATSTMEEFQTIPTYSAPEAAPPGSGTHAQMSFQYQLPPGTDTTRQTIPNAQPPVGKAMQQLPRPAVAKPKSGLAAWASFGSTTAKSDAEKSDKAYLELQARIAEDQRNGVSHVSPIPGFNETWRQVKTGDGPGQRQVVSASVIQHKFQPLGQVQSSLGDVTGELTPKPSGQGSIAPQVRSRYQDIFEQNQRAASPPVEFSSTGSASPPPPETVDHPAYLATSRRPLVNLPGSRPKLTGPRPTVRLPPPIGAPLQSSLISEARVANLRAVSLPLAISSSWQDKFNGLFDRKLSPEKKFVEVLEFSSSKVPLEHSTINPSAAVTLPPHVETEIIPGRKLALEIPQKFVEDEDALFEERDFGSVPTVRVPVMAPVHAWQPVGPPQGHRARFRILSDYDTMSVQALSLGMDETARSNDLPVIIWIDGMKEPQTRMMPRPTASGTLRPRAPYSAKARVHHDTKSRQRSVTHNSSKPLHATKSSSQIGSNQPVRAKGHTGNVSWARRASATVQ